MRKFKRFAAFGVSMLLAISMLASCSGEEQADESGVKYRQEGNRITATLGEKLTVDAELVGMPESDTAAVLQAKWDDGMDLETVKEALFPGETDLVEEPGAIRAQDNSFLLHGDDTYILSYFNWPTYGKLYNYLINQMDESGKRWMDPEELPGLENTNLESYSREQAISDVRDQLKQFGFCIEEEPYAMYGMNLEAMQEAYEQFRTSEFFEQVPAEYQNAQYSKEDEFYQMFWHVQLEGIPVLSSNYVQSSGDMITVSSAVGSGNVVQVRKTKDKIVELSSRGQYRSISKEEEQDLLSVGEVLAVVQDYYSARTILRAMKVEKISYCYIPIAMGDVNPETGMIDVNKDTEYTMIPGWCIEVSRDPLPYESIYWDVLCVNGITGEIIP